MGACLYLLQRTWHRQATVHEDDMKLLWSMQLCRYHNSTQLNASCIAWLNEDLMLSDYRLQQSSIAMRTLL